MHYLFCYGSNNPKQLSERLGRKLEPRNIKAAYAENWGRVFRGYSNKWGGGVATLVKDKNRNCYGYCVKVSDDELDILDSYEGVPKSYKRKNIQVRVRSLDNKVETGDYFQPRSVVVYLANSKEKNPPSNEYLKAIALTINTKWDNNGKKVKPSDIYNEK